LIIFFTERHSYLKIYEYLASDLFHQIIKYFYNYIHEWFLELIIIRWDSKYIILIIKEKVKCLILKFVKEEFDTRFSHLSSYLSLQQFWKRLSCTSWWIDNKFRNMIKIYMNIMHELISEDIFRFIKIYLNIHWLLSYINYIKNIFEILDMIIMKFWKILMNPHGSFIKFEIVKPEWHAPKLHYLRHYLQWMRQYDVLSYCSIDRTEIWHKSLKTSYKISNKEA